jgi:hypothetical protein
MRRADNDPPNGCIGVEHAGTDDGTGDLAVGLLAGSPVSRNRSGDETMTGAELMVRCLENDGVQYIFGIPGEETLDLNNALLDSKIRFITVRH